MGRINILIDDEIHKKAKADAAMKGLTLIEYINEAVNERLKKR